MRSMLPAVDWLDLALARETPFSRPVAAAHRAALEAAQVCGWIKFAGRARHRPCNECGAVVEVIPSGEDEFEAACECGLEKLAPEELALFRADEAELMLAIGDLCRTGQAPRNLIPARLWRLGYAQLAGARFPLWFARFQNTVDTHLDIAEKLKKASPSEQGVMVTVGPVNDAYSWPRGTTIARLCMLLTLDEPEVALNLREICNKAPDAAFIGDKGGRPRGCGDPLAVFRQRIREVTVEAAVRTEARAIHAILVDRYGQRALRLRSVEDAIRAEHATWKTARAGQIAAEIARDENP